MGVPSARREGAALDSISTVRAHATRRGWGVSLTAAGALTASKTACIGGSMLAILALFSTLGAGRAAYRFGLRSCHV